MKKVFWLIGITAILVIVLASPYLANADDIFNVTDLNINPSKVNRGEPAEVSVVVENTGDAPGSHTLELKINGTVEATEEVELDANTSKKTTFTITKDTAGEYSIEIAELKGVLIVSDSSFHVTDLDISPKYANTGEPIKISVDVTNVGTEESEYSLWLKLEKKVTLGAKASTTVSFTIIEDTTGEHHLEIGDLNGDFTVAKAPTPTPQQETSPWWRNWWFIGGAIGAVCIILLVLLINRLRQY